jgi:site-specific DNA-methyltransferase (adenine-specific)
MVQRLLHMKVILKPTGSLYLHCDPTASHYLKILLDTVFSFRNYRNEITWKRSTSHGNVGLNYGRLSDIIFFYTKSEDYTWNQQYALFDRGYIETKFTNTDQDDRRWQSVSLRNPGVRPNLQYLYQASNGITYKPHPNGWAVNKERMTRYDRENRLHYPGKLGGQLRLKQYLDERPGTRLQNIWDDIPAINSRAQERLGYPTQKPVALLERIISASSNEGDLVLDPFCGCGTTVHAAQKLNRRWVGIDITHLAIDLIEDRLRKAFPGIGFATIGVPEDLAGARDLAARDKHEFQKWIVAKAGGKPYQAGKKGMDRGIDGYLRFQDADKLWRHAVISVKGGESVNPGMIRDLRGTVERDNAVLGLFLSLGPPTREMVKEAAASGFYETGGQRIPRLQILTAGDLLQGKKPQTPFGFAEGYKPAAQEDGSEKRQGKLL